MPPEPALQALCAGMHPSDEARVRRVVGDARRNVAMADRYRELRRSGVPGAEALATVAAENHMSEGAASKRLWPGRHRR